MAFAETSRRGRGSCFSAALALAAACKLAGAPLGFLSAASRELRTQTRSPLAARLSEGRVARPSVAVAARGGARPDVALEVGCKVRAKSPDDQGWYPGRIKEASGNSWVVAWDDPDGGPETDTLSESAIKKIVFYKDYKVGDDCEAISPDDDLWYPGTVAAVLGEDKFRVRWDDPDGGDENTDVHWEGMKRVKVKRDYHKGDKVFAKFPDDGMMYPGTVLKLNKDGTFQVQWEDPDGGPEESDVSPKDMKSPPIPYDNLKVGQKYTGTVTSVKDFGAFVDIGAEEPGLMHISCISRSRVDDIYALLEEDQEVEVWISGVFGDGKFRVTMIEGRREGGDGRKSNSLRQFARQMGDEWFDGEVLRIEPFGAFVSVKLDNGQQAAGLVHVSQTTDTYVEEINDVLEVGQRVMVTLMAVSDKGDQLQFSMRWDLRRDLGLEKKIKPDVTPFLKIDPSTWIKGRITGLRPFGAFVEVTAPDGDATARGILYNERIRAGDIRNIGAELKVGQEVKVRVISVDTEKAWTYLSMRRGD